MRRAWPKTARRSAERPARGLRRPASRNAPSTLMRSSGSDQSYVIPAHAGTTALAVEANAARRVSYLPLEAGLRPARQPRAAVPTGSLLATLLAGLRDRACLRLRFHIDVHQRHQFPNCTPLLHIPA